MKKKASVPLRVKVCSIITFFVVIFVCLIEIWTKDTPLYATGPNATAEGIVLAIIVLSLLLGSGTLLAWSTGVFEKKNSEEKSVCVQGKNIEYHIMSKMDEVSCVTAFNNFFTKHHFKNESIFMPAEKTYCTFYKYYKLKKGIEIYGVIRRNAMTEQELRQYIEQINLHFDKIFTNREPHHKTLVIIIIPIGVSNSYKRIVRSISSYEVYAGASRVVITCCVQCVKQTMVISPPNTIGCFIWAKQKNRIRSILRKHL